MDNFIFLNYNIKIDKIYNNYDEKYFFINDIKIYIKEYVGDTNYLDTLVELTNNLYYNNIKVNTFILNNENKYYTRKDNKYIALLKVNTFEYDINIKNILKFHNIKNKLPEYNILNEWKEEVDTIEKQLIEYNQEYPLIQNSINYFIGLAENAIALLSKYEKEIINNNDSIGHKFGYKMYNSYKLGDPFNFIKVNKMYDLANFIKYKFYIKIINYDEITNIINIALIVIGAGVVVIKKKVIK